MAETCDEHPATYTHVAFIKEFCKEHGIEFVHITPDLGFHGRNWESLRGFYNAMSCCGSKAFPKTCTDRLKLQPIYRYVEAWIEKEYGITAGRKQGYVDFARKYGRIRMVVGIAAGEERRIADPAHETNLWKRRSIEMSYPLVDLQMDRAACQAYMRNVGLPCPPPSNCLLCPFMSEIELLWLYRFANPDFEDWCRIERRKLDKNAHLGDRNLGVWGKKTLPEKMEEVLAKHGHMTDEELHDYKFSHGHCVASKY